MTAAGRWRQQLEAWALPDELLASVPDSPYSWPPELWRRRHRESDPADSATTTIITRLLDRPGSVLDIGAGTGRASLPLVAAGHRLTAVERNPDMAAALREAAADADVAVVEDSWPEAASKVGRHDVVMCAHVVYDVQDIAPFVTAMIDAADRGVVVELTPRHPWSHLAPYYRTLHDLDRPDGPTADDFAAVARECGAGEVRVERWSRSGGLRFADRQELIEFMRRRLVLPVERSAELAVLLEPDIRERDGWLMLGDPERRLCTVWWRTVRAP